MSHPPATLPNRKRPRSSVARGRHPSSTPGGTSSAAYRKDYPLSYVRDEAVLNSLRTPKSAGWKVGIVTNGPASQETKIRVTGLVDLIDGYCISEVHGAPKPALSIFQAAAELAGCPLKGWMVGDSPESDIAGGRSAGLDTIWLARVRQWPHAEFAPDYICDSIHQAVELIRQR